ncbi:MAG: sigma 54-interacting transcriptional regulator [Muribaculaceae bacterium]|nr:sigma 54-interacting transcriptional regulator [Muribaculaceae bacterium]
MLETGEFIKVGSSTVQKTNIRVVAATNVDMSKAVAEGRFREDLFYRLSTVQINVPPLRERGNDITLLARKFAADFAEKYSTPELELTDSARSLLQAYRWPGNVRQLKNVIEQLALFEADGPVTRERLEQYLPATVYTPALASSPAGADSAYNRERDMLFNLIFSLRSEVDDLRSRLEAHGLTAERKPQAPALLLSEPADEPAQFTTFTEAPAALTAPATPRSLEETEREMIRESLERNGGRRKATALELNISERTLYRKIREYGLD